MAGRLLSRGRRPEDVPVLLRRTVRHGRAQHDGVPASRRGTVRALGRADACGLHVRGQDAADPARSRRHVRGAGRGARRPPRPVADHRREPPRRRAADVPARARCRRSSTWHTTFATNPGTASTASSASTTSTRSLSATSGCASLPIRRTTCAASQQRLRPPAYVYFRHEDAPTAPEYALRLLEMARRDHSSE